MVGLLIETCIHFGPWAIQLRYGLTGLAKSTRPTASVAIANQRSCAMLATQVFKLQRQMRSDLGVNHCEIIAPLSGNQCFRTKNKDGVIAHSGSSSC